MKNIIFIAPPAAGKGTQSKKISLLYNIPHISTGDLLRDEVNSGSNLGNFLKAEMDAGNLITDDIMINLLRTRITQVDCNNGYILDGYPRTVEQARVYDTLVQELRKEIGVVIFMDIDPELALERTLNRLVCTSCGASYNRAVSELKPAMDGFCDKCGHVLEIRSDDKAETFKQRFETYIRETQPLIDYYRQRGILKELKVNRTDSTEDVFKKIQELIN